MGTRLAPTGGSPADRSEDPWGWLTLRPDAAPPPQNLEPLLKSNPKFRKRWERDGQNMSAQSASADDPSRATMALQTG